MRPDGTAVELPTGRRPRGRTLKLAQAIRIRDELLALLVDGAQLSVPDALYVLSLAPISRPSAYDRLSKMPRDLRGLVSRIRGATDDGA